MTCKKAFFRAHLVTSLKALCKRNLIEKGFVANVVINELVQLRCRDYHVINKKGSINIIGLVATDIWTIYYLLNVHPISVFDVAEHKRFFDKKNTSSFFYKIILIAFSTT